MLPASELHARARADTNAGRHARAATQLRRALARTDDPDQTARILATLAYAEAELGHLDLAEDLCDRALALPGADAETRGVVHGQRGVVALRRGRTDDALADFDHAIASLRTDQAALGRNLLNRSNLHLEVGAPRRALADAELALAASERADLPRQAAKARHNVGYAAYLLGDPIRALTEMDAVAAYLSGLSPTSEAICLQDRAEVLASVGLHDDAVADLTRAIALLRATSARRPTASALKVLAGQLVLTDPAEGLRLARNASRRFAAMGAELGRLRAETLVAVCLRVLGRTHVPDAEPLMQQLTERGLSEEAGTLALAACGWLLEQGRLDEAAQVPLPRANPRRPDLWAALVAARRDAAFGRRAKALARAERALDGAQALKASLGSLEVQASLATAADRLGRLGVGLALARRDPELVFAWSERARAASSRVVPVRPPSDGVQAAALAELRTLVAFGRDPARQRALRDAIRARDWQHAGSGRSQPIGTLDSVGAALARRDATLVALLTADGRVSALVVTPASAELVDLGPLAPVEDLLAGLGADLDVAASDLPHHVLAGVRAGLRDRLAALDRALMVPLAAHLPGGRLVLTPSGAFAQVPWPLLPSLSGVPITVARSATAWAMTPDSPPPAHPVFVAGPRVPLAEAEVAACAAHWPAATVLTGEDARVSAVARAGRAADLVHLAAHGVHRAQNPLFSHVELADGPVFGYELDRLDPVPALVVLSACAVGGRSGGDDPLGLATALLHAGVRTVLASPAALGDAAASRLMPDLHARLAASVPASDALAAALTAFGADAPPLVCFGAGW